MVTAYTRDPRVTPEDAVGPVWVPLCAPCYDDCGRLVATVDRPMFAESEPASQAEDVAARLHDQQ